MEKIWYKDVLNFINIDNYFKFFPKDDMTITEKINSIMRFILYFSLLLYVFNGKTRILYLFVLCGIISYIVYDMNIINGKDMNEKYVNKSTKLKPNKCTKPNKLNPFMNVLMTEYKDNVDRPKACDVESTTVKKAMKKKFEHDLYRNVDDVFDRNYSYRQFYTTPSTTIPNDQEGFAKWLYLNEDNTCKEGNGLQCYNQING